MDRYHDYDSILLSEWMGSALCISILSPFHSDDKRNDFHRLVPCLSHREHSDQLEKRRLRAEKGVAAAGVFDCKT